jgi:hypothetical protein
MSEGANGNGAGEREPEGSALEPAPPEIAELAEACATYVERDTKVKLDYTPETLPLLDHWVAERRKEVGAEKDEILALVAAPVGAYLGEVARRVLRAHWFTPKGEYRRWRLELENVFLTMNPVGAAIEALILQEAEGWGASFRMHAEDEAHARAALDNLPEMELEDYFAPSNRLEVLEIVADALSRRASAEGEPPPKYGPSDYGPLRAEAIAEGDDGKLGVD